MNLGWTQKQQHTLKKGAITTDLNFPTTKNTFSIYLPKKYDQSKTWPVIIGFDSSGKTKNMTSLYKAAAEELGYIVVVTDFLEGQKPEEKANYVPVFLRYVFKLFPVQIGRVYVTAKENDAKLISLLPILYPKEISGVVAINDSYFYDYKVKMNKNLSYFGIVNENNHLYKNFLENKSFLKRKAVPADILIYEGDSVFPDQKLIHKVLSTFDIQAMLKGRIPTDSSWVKQRFQKDLDLVDEYVEEKKFIKALEELKRIRINYNLFFATDDLKEKQKEIKKLSGYKKERRLKYKYSYKENYFRDMYLFSAEEDIELYSYDNLGWWQHEMSKLDTLIAQKKPYESRMAIRVKGYLKYIVETYKMISNKMAPDFEREMFLNIFSTIVDSKDFESYKKVITLSVLDRDKETALFYLEKMLQNGYNDLDGIYSIEGTLSLRVSKEYNDLVKKYLGTSRYSLSK